MTGQLRHKLARFQLRRERQLARLGRQQMGAKELGLDLPRVKLYGYINI